MLSTALHTLRTRWVTFAGSFVALSLGVALIAVMGLALASSVDAPGRGPERFAAAPVVVRGQDTLTVPTLDGDRTRRLAQPRAVPAEAVAKLRGLGTVVEDRSFAVTAEGGPADLVGHPWSTAAFAPYELDAGRAPSAADEVVVSGDWARPGARVRTGAGIVRVVGTVAGLGFEDAVFYTDARAAQLSPRSLQSVVVAGAAAVREAVRGSAGVQVLTGDARRYADADPDRDSEALTAMNAMFGTAGGVAGFVSVFVVASTFAFAVAQRRREFGLLRTAGATPGQIRRMVVAEALVVGVLASAMRLRARLVRGSEARRVGGRRAPRARLVHHRRSRLAVPSGFLDGPAGGPVRCGRGVVAGRAHRSCRGAARGVGGHPGDDTRPCGWPARPCWPPPR